MEEGHQKHSLKKRHQNQGQRTQDDEETKMRHPLFLAFIFVQLPFRVVFVDKSSVFSSLSLSSSFLLFLLSLTVSFSVSFSRYSLVFDVTEVRYKENLSIFPYFLSVSRHPSPFFSPSASSSCLTAKKK